jgi:hypothetical protein
MPKAGRLVIIVLVTLGLAAALASVWYHRQSGRRALEFWGTETAVLIAQAPRIEVLELRPADRPADQPAANDPPSDQPIQRLGIGGRFYRVARGKDASQARGVSNIRRAMVLDATYQWDNASAVGPVWQYAMEFRNGKLAAIVLLDFDSGQVGCTNSRRTAILDPAAISDWRSFFQEQFAEAN